MQLHNEFFVQVPLERAWETLLDIETVAGFLPGATVDPPTEDGAYRGQMKLKVGPVVTTYRGTARLGSVDSDARQVVIEISAKEAHGQGTAAAVIRNELKAENGGTRVTADTDLRVTGRQAQFGRGLMQEVAGRTLDEFAHRFESYLVMVDSNGDPQPSTEGAPHVAPQAKSPNDDEALDIGAVVARTVGLDRAIPLAVVALVIVLLLLGRRASSRSQRTP